MPLMTPIRLLSLFFLLLAPIAGQALAPVVERQSLHPSPEQARATELITHFVANYHYRKTRVDDALSGRVFDEYLDALDPARSFFTASDVAALGEYRLELDDQIRSAELDAAFQIFLVFRERVAERTAHALGLLAGDFDFSVDETFQFDRSKAAWAADLAEMNDLWRRRVKNDVLSLRIAGKNMDEIRETLKRRYEGIRRQTEQLNSDDVFQLFMNAFTTSIEPHTAYFSPRSSENFRIRMSLSLEGIGAVLQTDNEYTVVREVVPGGPAAKSTALAAGDRIVGIAQGSEEAYTDVVGWRLDDVVDLIRGPKGSVVRLQVLPKGLGVSAPPRELTLTRNRIALEEQAAKKHLVELDAPAGRKKRIGVIDLPTFYMDFDARQRGEKNYRSTTRDVRRLIGELQAGAGIDGLVIDLRGNGGGSLTEATELTGLFIASGPVVQVRDSSGRVSVEKDPDPEVFYGGPLAVLVDRNSASASEIFAGAIQDYRRGIIIGEPTFGKGTVQNLVDLDQFDRDARGGLGQLKATIAQFFRVAGGSTQHKGVVPDVTFPLGSRSDEEGERGLPNALPWDEVTPAQFVPVRAPVESFERARELHRARVSNADAFKVLVEEARAIETLQAQTTVTLEESARRAEQTRTEAEALERQNRLRAAQGLPPLEKVPGADDAEPVADEKKDDPAHDVLLEEAAHILGDLIEDPGASPAQPAMVDAAKAG